MGICCTKAPTNLNSISFGQMLYHSKYTAAYKLTQEALSRYGFELLPITLFPGFYICNIQGNKYLFYMAYKIPILNKLLFELARSHQAIPVFITTGRNVPEGIKTIDLKSLLLLLDDELSHQDLYNFLGLKNISHLPEYVMYNII